MEKQQSQKEERQRRFLLVLPVLVIPFLTLMFWALGGGSANEAKADVVKGGINMTLPDPNFSKDRPKDKMSYYDHAEKDSAKMREMIKADPYYHELTFSGITDTTITPASNEPADMFSNSHNVPYNPDYSLDNNEMAINDKLEKLNAALQSDAYNKDQTELPPNRTASGIGGDDIDRLEQMIHKVNSTNDHDSGMDQLNNMLEKILDIQHPERINEKLKQQSEMKKGEVFPVYTTTGASPVSLLQPASFSLHPRQQQNGFFSFDDFTGKSLRQNVIEAVVQETQTAVSGSVIKLRLLNNVFINGVLVPKDCFIYGIASLDGERLNISISGIRYLNNVFPVDLKVYDLDGLSGIYVPGAITRDVAKQSAERSVRSIGISSIDPSWQMQAAGAGIEAAKSLFSKKVKLVKVTLKAGYKVLLYDEKQKQEAN